MTVLPSEYQPFPLLRPSNLYRMLRADQTQRAHRYASCLRASRLSLLCPRQLWYCIYPTSLEGWHRKRRFGQYPALPCNQIVPEDLLTSSSHTNSRSLGQTLRRPLLVTPNRRFSPTSVARRVTVTIARKWSLQVLLFCCGLHIVTLTVLNLLRRSNPAGLGG